MFKLLSRGSLFNSIWFPCQTARFVVVVLKEWSIITGRRGRYKMGRGGGQVALPLQKGGGGRKKVWGSFSAEA